MFLGSKRVLRSLYIVTRREPGLVTEHHIGPLSQIPILMFQTPVQTSAFMRRREGNANCWSSGIQGSMIESPVNSFSRNFFSFGDCERRTQCSGEDIVEIPEECVGRVSIVEECFGSSVFDTEGKSILGPKNEDSLKINEQVLARFPGQNVTYFIEDSIISEDQEEKNNFQLDFINGITPSGMPPHVLNLKVGAVILCCSRT
ncbi:ATP-dependent DNA helicase [Trichonephila clavipes]|uniref:ATP-dependent DNA helicase n=1 Tax=Trichonephila clavipes TaxID=2585209 RepID=A0A8X6WIK5_TRICX|nr:ATP-dependent DNA helicase [Trichonephila clavipes]